MQDFKHTTDGDIDLTSGDIVMAEATLQHQRDILRTRIGELKDTPTIGVGIEDYLNDESPEDLLRKARKELVKDGQKVVEISSTPTGKIEISAYYEADYNN